MKTVILDICTKHGSECYFKIESNNGKSRVIVVMLSELKQAEPNSDEISCVKCVFSN